MVFAAMFICLITLAALMGGGLTAYAESPVSSSDGTYSVPVNLSGLAMGADNFSSSATVEKSSENYYMTFGHSSSISDMVLESGNMQTGYTSYTESGWTYYTYTILHLYHVRRAFAEQPFLFGVYQRHEQRCQLYHYVESF